MKTSTLHIVDSWEIMNEGKYHSIQVQQLPANSFSSLYLRYSWFLYPITHRVISFGHMPDWEKMILCSLWPHNIGKTQLWPQESLVLSVVTISKLCILLDFCLLHNGMNDVCVLRVWGQLLYFFPNRTG